MNLEERACRLLLRSYPRSLRSAHGEEMVGLVIDRRRLGGEPWWQVWPSVVLDTVRTAPLERCDELSTRHRAIALGALVSITVLAVLSDGPVLALPVVVPAGAAGLALGRWQPPCDATASRRASRQWTRVGAVLLVVAWAGLQGGDDRLAMATWAIGMASLLGGVFAIVAGLALRTGGQRRTVAT